VQQVLVCNPRRNALLKEGSKSDKADARKRADLLRTGMLRPVYHGENGVRTLRELARSYQTISKDLTRVMNRLKAPVSRLGHSLCRHPALRRNLRPEFLAESRKHKAAKLLRQIPCIGPIRAAPT
jgi:hypothetical protein